MPKILLIDDDPIYMEIMAAALKKGKFDDIREALSGDEGIKMFSENPADIVVTDVIMPDKTGMEILMTIKSISPKVKVVVVTGGGKVGSESYLELAKKLGAEMVFEKPFNIIDFANGIKKLSEEK